MSTPTPDHLGNVVTSPKARRVIYTVYVCAIILLGATQVAYAAIQAGQPDWLTAALAVAAYLGVPVGGLAAINTQK